MDELFTMQALTRYAQIWQEVQAGKALPETESIIANAMKAHPEFDPFWTQGEAALHAQEIGNYIVKPLVHTGLHVVVEQQLADKTPAEAASTLKKLMQSGLSRHDAMHQIVAVWGDLYFRSIRQGESLYEWEYIELLNGLARAASPLK